MKSLALVVLVAASGIAGAQQPNTPNASLIINGVGGPPYPIALVVQTSAPASGLLRGAANAPWALLKSATGFTQAGSATFFGDVFDLPLSPPPFVEFNGFVPGSPYHMDANGIGSIPGISLVTRNHAYQALVADPFAPAGFSLTAATDVALSQNWTSTQYTLGDESITTVNLPGFQVPFYGTGYSTVQLCSNGYVTFTASTSDFTPSSSEFNSGSPRLAGFWTDLDCPANAVKVTIAAPSANAPGLVRFDYTNVHDYVAGILHTFSMQIHTNGLIQIDHRLNMNPGAYDLITGIGPGGGASTVPQKDLSAIAAPNGSYSGAVNESFFEWFGIISQHPYYGNPFDDPYDLQGKLLTFLPSAAGASPASTLQYLMY